MYTIALSNRPLEVTCKVPIDHCESILRISYNPIPHDASVSINIFNIVEPIRHLTMTAGSTDFFIGELLFPPAKMIKIIVWANAPQAITLNLQWKPIQQKRIQIMSEKKQSNIYGSKGQTWADTFVEYMDFIVNHENYSGMPDAIKKDGKIQWEAPTNRASGEYQYTNDKRRKWWNNKAKELGIDTEKNQWISAAAKLIHPTGKKPCKRCGEEMYIAYVYPSNNLLKRIDKFFPNVLEVSTFDTINDVLYKLYIHNPDSLFSKVSGLLSTKDISIPEFGGDYQKLIDWVIKCYIPLEPSMLSPGAMSNAPDRFDGFHSFNKCCRGKADSGRSKENLRTYSTDRRVFEFWSDGDWIAADRMMGLIARDYRNEPCEDGGSPPATADHIGPISLGFCHSPTFKLLSRAANSAKNNRMTLSDVQWLLREELSGKDIASWYAKPIWDGVKHLVDNEEKALRLSKIMRDNQRNAMYLLSILYKNKQFTFLCYLLGLGYADYDVEFEGLIIENYITKFSFISKSLKNSSYSSEKKARRIRIGFNALREYYEKDNRHTYLVFDDVTNKMLDRVVATLKELSSNKFNFDREIEESLVSDELLKKVSLKLENNIPQYESIKADLTAIMNNIANNLILEWDTDRYVR
ncbi:Alw26I/Eco31I/Esp3I family type II restriction endonuclease [Vibrio parahaemolyticus]|uniref:Alw26I/Eco31I/Esp3I family type II restriction endonuclease n=2 Tax=Vibrio harveyi group TaxID=717610 RepID=UPI0018A1AD70|nr:Alw26I/Eco31I/Esp3I family type II restriction endonuclease [Vibrio parahaemolyticus]MDZ5179394.1 Alw26I/Eco31I/Esp3I family type II restriction endonuclease [Vibrio parahaemolyticus]HCE3365221.1 Alw26I/Eco31I/Esp3I family type II restriction endonuclease [Vibrio parahaemolyticus]